MAYKVVPKKAFRLYRTGNDCTRCPVAEQRQQQNAAVLAALRAYDDGSKVTGMTEQHRRDRVILPVAEHDRLLLEDDGYREAVAAYEAQQAANIAKNGLCRSLGGARETIGSENGVTCALEFLNEE